MPVRRRGAGLLVALALVAAPRSGRAQPSTGAAAAEALFDDGRELMKRGDLAHACPKLAESQRLDPAPGTALALGACWERAGRVASAHAAFRSAVQLATDERDADRAAAASERLATLTPRLPRAQLVLASGDAQRPGLVATCDDAPVPAPIDAPWPVDPGDRVVEVQAPGKQPVRVAFRAFEGAVVDVVIPPLVDLPASSAPATRPPPRPRSEGWSATTTAGAVVAGAGLATVAVGAVFGITALADASALDELGYDAARSTCPASNLTRCTEAYDAATSSGTTATILLAGGGALVAGGVALFLLGADDGGASTAVGVRIGPGAGLLHAGGRF